MLENVAGNFREYVLTDPIIRYDFDGFIDVRFVIKGARKGMGFEE